MIPFPDRKYSIIYADPPWERLHRKGRGAAANHYDVLKTRDIAALPVEGIADTPGVLFLWATWPTMPDAIIVAEAWGFDYKTAGFVWVKETASGMKYHFGMGAYTRANTEPCLLCVRPGKLLPRVDRAVRQLLFAPVQEHSRKPAEVRDRIVRLYGDVPRIELFARQRVPGWDALGYDIDGKDIRQSLGLEVPEE